ncbi:MAG: hypothetical protein QOG30_3008 [Acidimicrobiaceae bacterium]
MTTWSDELFDELAHEGDPLVDAVIAEHVATSTPAPPSELVSSLAKHLVLPPAARSVPIHRYLSQRPALPAWTDDEKLQRSADFFDQNGLMIGSALFCASLPEAYAGARGARVLTLTTTMVTDPVRRVYETAQMVLDAMTAGGLDPATGAGYEDIRRVRLMHAAVRYLVLNDPTVRKTKVPEPYPSWCLASGVPINQEDLFGTLMTFTSTVFESLDRLGVEYSPEEADSYLHAWCVVGHLLGLRAKLLPLTLDDAREITAAVRRRQNCPSPDGVELSRALVGAMRETVRFRALRPLPKSMVRWSVGPDVAVTIGLSRHDPFALAFDGVAFMMRRFGLLERHNKFLRGLSRHVGAAALDSFVAAGRTGNRPPFSLPGQLDQQVSATRARRWRL